jgi:universal stress protein A
MIAKYKRILVAVDASEEAEQVLRAATNVDPRGAESYYLVTVVPPVMAGVGGMDGASLGATWPLKELEAAAMKEIADSVRERAARFGITPERVAVLYGRPATEIHAQARKIQADLIVIGAHGRHGLPRLMLGSTANAVLHDAPCDVLTVRIAG